jgi:hypothetical protein
MKSFWAVAPEIPNHISIMQVSLRVSLLAVNEIRELDGILDEEYWGVVSDHIVISLFSVELYSESSGISFSICSSLFSCNCRKSNEAWSSLSYLVKELGFNEPMHL